MRNGRPPPEVHDGSEGRGDPHRAGELGNAVSEKHREHRGEDDDGHRDEQIDPEQLPELRDVVTMPGMPCVTTVPGVVLMGAVRFMVVVCAGGVLLRDGGGAVVGCGGVVGVLCAGFPVVMMVGVVVSVHTINIYPRGVSVEGLDSVVSIDARELLKRGRGFITSATASRPLTPMSRATRS